jgi:hypothetical protein
MARALNSFWLDLALHHPNCDPRVIAQSLGLQPWFSAKAGQPLGTLIRNTTVCMFHFREGMKDEEFAQALEDFITFLETNRGFLETFIAEGGAITLTLNRSIAFDDGVLLRLQLQPFFLEVLGDHGVGLELQAWSTSEDQPPKND